MLCDIDHLGHHPIWEEMESRLTEKYLSAYHRNHLSDQLLNLRQTTSSIFEYMAQFEEQVLHCDIHEDYWVMLLGL